jgi:hypothetical protein
VKNLNQIKYLTNLVSGALTGSLKTGFLAGACAFLLYGCTTTTVHQPTVPVGSILNDTPAAQAQIKSEKPGNDYIGCRVHFGIYSSSWGFIRRTGESWKTAKLVMLNEQHQLAPDKAAKHIGSDNGYVYKLNGYFSGQYIYDPSSDRFMPEFVLTHSQLLSHKQSDIFPDGFFKYYPVFDKTKWPMGTREP